MKVKQNVASVFVQALFFTMLTLNARYKENRLTKCSHTDKPETPGHKKQRENGKGKKKNRTCLQGRLKIKRNTIPACIWVEARPPLPP